MPTPKTAATNILMRVYASVITAAFLGIFAWAWNTSAQMADLSRGLENDQQAVRAIPQMQIDIAVIKQSQQTTSSDINEIKDSIKELARMESRRPVQ